MNWVEDDEFEEFNVEDWTEEKQVDTTLWQDNWDDDEIEDDFSVQLRTELSKLQSQQTM